VWGDASVPAALVLGGQGNESGLLRRNVGLAGFTFRSAQKIRLSVDYEGSPGDRSYFRTSLNQYQRARIQARYQVLPALEITAHFGVLSNQNPAPAVNFDFLSRDNTLSAYWMPAGGKRMSILAEYIPLPAHGSMQPKLSLGGSLFDSGGTRPTRYYQPFGKFLIPVGKHVQWNAEWRWYGLTQQTYLYEGFRSFQFTTGFRLSR
jgi:hypothetical protein